MVFNKTLLDTAASAVRHILPSSVLSRAQEARRRRQFAGDARYCPVCQSGLSSFTPREWFRDAVCPVCFCKDCHRAVWLFLERLSDTFSTPISMLHIAPEAHFGVGCLEIQRSSIYQEILRPAKRISSAIFSALRSQTKPLTSFTYRTS